MNLGAFPPNALPLLASGAAGRGLDLVATSGKDIQVARWLPIGNGLILVPANDALILSRASGTRNGSALFSIAKNSGGDSGHLFLDDGREVFNHNTAAADCDIGEFPLTLARALRRVYVPAGFGNLDVEGGIDSGNAFLWRQWATGGFQARSFEVLNSAGNGCGFSLTHDNTFFKSTLRSGDGDDFWIQANSPAASAGVTLYIPVVRANPWNALMLIYHNGDTPFTMRRDGELVSGNPADWRQGFFIDHSARTGAWRLCRGTTAERPNVSGIPGALIRWNTDLNHIEKWDGSTWSELGGTAGAFAGYSPTNTVRDIYNATNALIPTELAVATAIVPAQTTANNALAAANAAQGTANTALANAATADGHASTAQTAANTAQGTANTAQARIDYGGLISGNWYDIVSGGGAYTLPAQTGFQFVLTQNRGVDAHRKIVGFKGKIRLILKDDTFVWSDQTRDVVLPALPGIQCTATRETGGAFTAANWGPSTAPGGAADAKCLFDYSSVVDYNGNAIPLAIMAIYFGGASQELDLYLFNNSPSTTFQGLYNLRGQLQADLTAIYSPA